jgi:hypothetical protein
MPLNIDKNEKRARFDALPSPEVSSDEVRNIPVTGRGYVGRIVEWLKPKGVLGQYKNDETGWDNIAVNRSSVKSVTHHRAGVGKIALLEATPYLIKNGIFLETNPKNDNGLISHIFAGKATIDGVSYAVSYVVREDINGRRYYDHSLTKIEALDRIDDQAPTHITDKKREGLQPKEKISPVSWPTAQPAGEESTVNILKKHLGVNTKK